MTFSLLFRLPYTPMPMTPPFITPFNLKDAPLNSSELYIFLEQLTSYLSRISNWGRENMVVFNASKTQLLHLSTRHNLPNYDIFFENTQLKPSSVLNILGVSFSRDLSWKHHITSLSKQSSKRLGVLRRLRSFFTPPQLETSQFF